MKRAHIAFCGLALVGILLAWNTLLFGPKSRERKAVKAQVASARSDNDALRSELEQLRQARDHQEADQAVLDRIRQLMPSDDDMADFIRSMDDLAVRTQVDWASLAPSAAVATPGGNSGGAINISISVAGTFFELLDYLDGLAALDRLVVIDSVQIGGSGPAETGELKLVAALSGRIFSASSGGAAKPPTGTTEGSDTVAAASPGTGGN